MKNALVILFTGVISLFALLLLFGKSAPDSVIPTDSGAVIEFAKPLVTAEKVMTSDALKIFSEAGIGGEGLASTINGIEQLRSQKFFMDAVRFIAPEISIATTSGDPIAENTPMQFLTIIDLGRPLLFLHYLGAGDAIKKGSFAFSHEGHNVSSDGRFFMTVLKNLIVLGDQTQVKKAIDVFEGRDQPEKDVREKFRNARRLLDPDAEIRGLILSGSLFSAASESKEIDPRVVIQAKNFSHGAFNLKVENTGLRGDILLQALPGKTLLTALSTGVDNKPFQLSRFIEDRLLYVGGFRSNSLSDFTDILITHLSPKLAVKDGKSLGRRLANLLFSELLKNLGPEILVSVDDEGRMNIVGQVKDEARFKNTISAKQKEEEAKELEKFRGALKLSTADIEIVLKQTRLTPEKIRSYVDGLPEPEQTAAKKLIKDLVPLIASLPGYESVTLNERPYYYQIDNGLFYLVTDPKEIQRLKNIPTDPPMPAIRTFLDGGPFGSAFFSVNISRIIYDSLPRTKSTPDYENLFKNPWLAVAQIKDEGGKVVVEGGLDADFGLTFFGIRSIGFYLVLFHLLRLLLIAFALWMGFILLRRFARIIVGNKGDKPLRKKKTAAR